MTLEEKISIILMKYGVSFLNLKATKEIMDAFKNDGLLNSKENDSK
jgi:hypothetical protein